MAARTPQEAIADFLEPLKDVVACIIDEGFVARRPRRGDPQQSATFQDGFVVLTTASGLALKLELYQRFRVDGAGGGRGPFKASITEYVYDISDQRDDTIVAFHWHPESRRIRWPHLHVHGDRTGLTLHKLHLPTGRTSIESVVRFLIEDLSVPPIKGNWDRILARREAAFRQQQSWH